MMFCPARSAWIHVVRTGLSPKQVSRGSVLWLM